MSNSDAAIPRSDRDGRHAPRPGVPRRAGWFAIFVVFLYGAFALWLTASRHFDLSVLVIAGDRYVDPAQAAGLYVRPRSDGYDGQFFARLAIEPLSTAPRVKGIALHEPARRMGRALYPLLAHIVTLGGFVSTPVALVLVNLAGLGGLAWLAWSFAARYAMPFTVPLAVVTWPGFAVAISHDTSEIIAAACLLGAVMAWLDGRLMLYFALGAAATLARETSLLLLAGVALVEGLTAMRSRRSSRRFAVGACAMAPFFAWRMAVAWLWRGAARDQLSASDLDWPVLGPLRRISAIVTGLIEGRGEGMTLAIYELTTIAAILAFCAVTLPVAMRAARSEAPDREKGVAVGLLLMLGLMSVLSSTGPWVEPAAYFRAFSETFVLGSFVLGMAWSRCGHAGRAGWLAGATAFAATFNVALCLAQTR